MGRYETSRYGGASGPTLLGARRGLDNSMHLVELDDDARIKSAEWLDACSYVASAENATFLYLERSFDIWKATMDDFAPAARSNDRSKAKKVIEVVGSTVDLLNSMRLFLDHTEVKFKRFDLTLLDTFHATCSREYDNHFSYRFLYKLRNYSQHIHLPVTEVRHSEGSWGLYITRDTLLKEFSGWSADVRREIGHLPRSIHLNPLIETMFSCARRIDSKITELTREFTLDALEKFEEMRAYFTQRGLVPVEVDLTDGQLENLTAGDRVIFSQIDTSSAEIVSLRYMGG